MLRLIPGAKSWNLFELLNSSCTTGLALLLESLQRQMALAQGWDWTADKAVVKPPNSCCLNPTLPKSIQHLDSQHQNFSKHFPKIISKKTSQLPKFTTPIWTIRPPPSKAIRRRSGRRGRCTGPRPGWWPPTCGAPWWAPWNGWSRSRLWWCLGGWEGGEKVDFLGVSYVGTPIAGWFLMEYMIKMDDMRVPPWPRKTSFPGDFNEFFFDGDLWVGDGKIMGIFMRIGYLIC